MELARRRKYTVAAYLLYIAAYYLILLLEIEPFISHTSTVGLLGDFIALTFFWWFTPAEKCCGPITWTF